MENHQKKIVDRLKQAFVTDGLMDRKKIANILTETDTQNSKIMFR